jgi:beta-hydroxylase
MFYDPEGFAFLGVLRDNWPWIYEEYRTISDALVDWFEKELYGDGWQVFGLFDFPHGRPIEANSARCPLTAALIEEHIPNHGAAGFSVLQAHTRIRPHCGYPGSFLRCHLGLAVPAGDCALQVAGEVRRWHAGELLVFDDRVCHEAWNETNEPRAVLLVDFIHHFGASDMPQPMTGDS